MVGHRPWLVLGLRAGALALVWLALLGWASPSGIERLPALGRQVFFVVDVSGSMNVADVGSTRLDKVKRELKRAMRRLAGEQMGLIAYTNFAYTVCPLTTDVAALETYVDMLSSAQFAAQGSELRPALYEARRRFDEDIERAGDDGDRARAVVLISDGEDHGGKFSSAVALLRDLGAVVLPVGVGTRAGGLVPNLDAQGRPQGGVRRAPDGGVARSQREDETLRKLGEAFGQSMLIIDGADDTLEPVVRAIEQLPAARLPGQAEGRATDTYPVWTLLAVLLLGASLFIKPRRG